MSEFSTPTPAQYAPETAQGQLDTPVVPENVPPTGERLQVVQDIGTETLELANVVLDPAPGYSAEALGFKTNQGFSTRAEDMLIETAQTIDFGKTALQLEELGLDIDPRAAPNAGEYGIIGFDYLTTEDKKLLESSENPLVTLWGLSSLRIKQKTIEEGRGLPKEGDWGGIEQRQSDEALIQSLGLVHGTNFQALLTALEQGKFKANRQIDDTTKGNTHYFDRDLGLDDYVFADFGRPHRHRAGHPSDVEVVFDQSALDQPGAFMTEKDIADTEGGANVREYLRGVVESPYLIDAVRNRLRMTVEDGGDIIFGRALNVDDFANGKDGDPVTIGPPKFSTWEAKMPEVGVDKIKKIIFHDKAQYGEFLGMYGEEIDAEFVDRTAPHKYVDYKEVAANEVRIAEQFAQEVDADLSSRLAELPEDSKEKIWAAFPITVFDKHGFARKNWRVSTGRDVYIASETEDELREQLKSNPSVMDPKIGDEMPITTRDGRYMMAYAERSKNNPKLIRFLSEVKSDSVR